MIYFMTPIDGGPIKIGFTDDLATRHKQLEARYGRELTVIGTIDGGRSEEAEIHARFAHLRLGRTEQFQPAPEVFEFIGVALPLTPPRCQPMAPVMPPEAQGQVTRRVVLQMKGSEEWKAWLDRLSRFLRMPTSTIVDHALLRYAREMGFEGPPPGR